MSINKELLALIKKEGIIRKIAGIKSDEERIQVEKEYVKALDELLRASPTDPAAFKAAIRKHQGFWKKFLGSQNISMDQDNFLDASDQTNTFVMIHQEAAKQRVTRGIQTAEEDVLVAILKNNPQECRAYLASKKSLGNLTSIAGWQLNTPNPNGVNFSQINTHTGVLPDQAIIDIKEETARLLLLKKIEQSNDINLLSELYNSSELGDFKHAIEELGFPSEINNISSLLFDNFYDNDDHVIAKTVSNRIDKLKKDAAKKAFAEYVNGFTTQELLAKKDLLEQPDQGFMTALGSIDNRFKENFTQANDVKYTKGLLATRYLQTYLPANQNKEQLLSVINARTDMEMRNAIKPLLANGDKNYIDYAITPETMNATRVSLVQGIISTLPDPRSLITAKNLDEFKRALKAIGVDPVDWVNDEAQMLQMKNTANIRYFELTINKISNLGAGAHTKLKEAFSTLEPGKQLAILQNGNNEIRHLLNAQDGASLKHYLGDVKPSSLIIEIIAEHQNGVLFKGIHNAQVAKILSGINPPIELNEAKVNAINLALKTGEGLNAIYTDNTQYKILVDNIKAQCGVVDSQTFYKGFGLTNDGNGFINPEPPNPIRQQIGKQQEYNRLLTNGYKSTLNQANKKFFDAFMSVSKTRLLTATEWQNINGAFRDTSSLTDFIEKVKTIKADDDTFIKGLTNELTTRKYTDIQTALRRANLSNKKPEEATAAIERLSSDIEALKENQKSLVKGMDNLKPFLDIKPIHLFNPTFQGKAKEEAGEMREKYQEMAEECTLVMDKLRRDQFALDSYLKSVPQSHPNSKVNAQLQQLRESVSKEIQTVNERYQFYSKIHDKISGKNGILEAIDMAVQGNKSYYYQSREISRHRYKISAGNPYNVGSIPQTGVPLPGNLVRLNPGTMLQFLLDEKLQPHEALVYDIKYQTRGTERGNSVSVDSYARVTQRVRPDLAKSVSEEGVVTKTDPVEFEVSLPQPNTTKGQSDANVEEARLTAALEVAKDILAKMDAPPNEKNKIELIVNDDPEGMRYLWTALVILGEKDPNMKFNMNAIDVRHSKKFDPSNEGGVTFGISHFSSDSLYKTVFSKKEYQTIISSSVKELRELTEEKMVKKKESSEVAKKSMQDMKSSVKEMKQSVEDKIKTEGAAPEVPLTSVKLNVLK